MRSYIVGYLRMTYVFEHNRIFGLDPLDWLVLFAGSVLSGVIALLV